MMHNIMNDNLTSGNRSEIAHLSAQCEIDFKDKINQRCIKISNRFLQEGTDLFDFERNKFLYNVVFLKSHFLLF